MTTTTTTKLAGKQRQTLRIIDLLFRGTQMQIRRLVYSGYNIESERNVWPPKANANTKMQSGKKKSEGARKAKAQKGCE